MSVLLVFEIASTGSALNDSLWNVCEFTGLDRKRQLGIDGVWVTKASQGEPYPA